MSATTVAHTYDFVRFENDQAAEHWGVIDSAALMEQLGIAPAGA